MREKVLPQTNFQTIVLIGVLVGVSAVNPLGMNIFIPSMPSMVQYFDSSTAVVQLILSLYLLASAASMLVMGQISDKFGRKPVLLTGLALFVIGSIICTIATTIWILIFGRIIQAIGGACGLTISRAIVRDLFSRDRAASMMGYVNMCMAVAPMVGPLIGGTLHELYGWRTVFGFLMILGLIVLLITWIQLPETLQKDANEKAKIGRLESFAILLRDMKFWLFSTTTLLCSGTFFAFLGGGPFIAEEILGMTPREYGVFFVFVASGYILGNFITGRFSVRFGIGIMITVGNILALIGVSAIAILFALGFFHPLSLFAPMFVIGMGNGLTLPNAIAGAVSVRPDLAGAASGLAGCMQISAGGLATLVMGWLLGGVIWPGTIWPLVFFMGLISISTMIVGIFTVRAT